MWNESFCYLPFGKGQNTLYKKPTVFFSLFENTNFQLCFNLYKYTISFSGLPKVKASLTNLRVLKTTQSAFIKFFRDDYTTLPEAEDRVFSTIVEANWDYNTPFGVDFDKCWNVVKDSILDKFAGPPDTGLPSPSVQNTLYLAEKMVLESIKQV